MSGGSGSRAHSQSAADEPLPPERMLLVRVDRIGDMLTSTPLFRALRESRPQMRIDLVASDKNRAAVEGNPHVDRCWVLPLKRYWTWPLLVLRLRGQGYGLAADLNPSYSRTSGYLVRWSGAPRRVSFSKKKAERFYTSLVPQSGTQHMIERQLNLARALGAEASEKGMVFPVPEPLRSSTRDTYPRCGSAPRVGLFVGNAKKVHTRWPEAKFAELARLLLAESSAEVFVLAGPADRGLLRVFDGRWSNRLRLLPEGTLAEIGAFLETCDLLITSSSGPMHLAAAVGTPTLSILAEHTYTCWRPLGDRHRAVHSGLDGVDVRPVPVDDVWRETRGMLSVPTVPRP